VSTLQVRADPSERGLDAGRLERITTHFDRYVERGRLSGWLATVTRGGDLVWTGRGGLRDREAGLAVADDTVWRMYSMTKPVAALAAMILYEEGRFDLNDEVSQWIEELAAPRVYVAGPADDPETVPAEAPVRVWHLFTHTSGLTYGFKRLHVTDEIYRAHGHDFGWPPSADLASAVHDWCTMPLAFTPGTRFNYSVSSDVLGRLIEIWSGQSIEEFFRTRVLDPLGMTDTDWWCPPERADRLAALYLATPGESARFDLLGAHATRAPRLRGAGGGLVSTAADYERFMRLLLGRGELDGVRLVSAHTMDLMMSNHLPGGADLATVAFDDYAEADFEGFGYGLGGFVVDDPAANRSLFSRGTFGWGSAASSRRSSTPPWSVEA